ncbi:MAG: aspartate--tRNA(Asn) ligase [Bacilli bacterium]|nr:aspartate--tRNA(Asn) ligase [Bacilli bacterium]MBR6136661.1 aspartate--tRNA(Asn) ligase [Bacilli bacterium]
MMKIHVDELKEHLGEEISFSGFVDEIRNLKWVMFVVLRDNTGKVQMTLEKSEEKNQPLLEIMANTTVESTVKVTGLLQANEAVKLGGMEIIPTNIEVTSLAENLPFDFNNLEGVNIDTRMDYRWIDLRNEKNMLVRQVESCFVEAMREFLYENRFTEIHTPKLIGAASESGSSVFEVKYFDRAAYLAQSPQFYKQMAMAAGMNRIFEVAPCFRAENSNTNRHATEFTSFDLEFSYIDSYEDVMSLEEDLLIAGLTKVKERYGEKIKEVFGNEVIIPKKPFPRMRLMDLYQELHDRYGFDIPKEDVGDMNAEAEKLTYQLAKEKFDSEFMFVVDYAATKRPFYHMRDENGKLQGYDLIWRGTEITSGAQREHRYEELKKNADEKGLGKDVEFYLQFFKYGCPPHGGFAIGVDRLTMLLTGLSIKETQFLFRGPNRLAP